MAKPRLHRPIAVACSTLLPLLLHPQALAGDVAFCRVQGSDACATPTSIGSDSAINIRGRLPVGAAESGHTLTIEHTSSGRTATVPLRVFRDAQGSAEALAGARYSPGHAAQKNLGAEALIYTLSLPAGEYRVRRASIRMAAGGTQDYDLSIESGARFEVPGSSLGGISIIRDGEVVANGLKTARPVGLAGRLPITGYPALRNGSYTLQVSLGPTTVSRNFILQRPSRSVDVSLPYVEGLPEVGARLLVNDILKGRSLSGDTLLTNDSSETVSVNGRVVAPGQSFPVSFAQGQGGISISNDSEEFAEKSIPLFNNAPDGENLILRLSRWRVEDQYLMQPSKTTAAIKVDPIAVSPVRVSSSPKCAALRPYEEGERLFETTHTLCAVQWLDRKGVSVDRFQRDSLRGELQELGTNTLRYRMGVIYTNPVTRATAFYPSRSGQQSFDVVGFAPDLPTLEFAPYSLYQPLRSRLGMPPSKHLVRLSKASESSGQLMGSASVSAPFGGLRTRIVTSDDAREYSTGFNRVAYPVTQKVTEALAEKPVAIEAWYEKAPEFRSRLDLTAVGVPIGVGVFPDAARQFHSEQDTVISGRVGQYKGTRIEYSPEEHGRWEVRLYRVDGPPAEIGRTPIQDDGTFSINLGRQTPAQVRLRAVAHLIADGSASDFTAQTSTDFYATVYDGRAPTGRLRARTDSGAVPFSAMASIQYDEAGFAAMAQPATWEVSSDAGATWQALQDERGRPVLGQSISRRFTDAGQYMLRATLRNKYSGLTHVTEPVALQAFLRGSARITMPAAAAVGTMVTASADLSGFGDNPLVRWQLLKGSTVIARQEGVSSFSFSQDQADTYTVRLMVRDAEAPTDAGSAWVTKEAGIRIVDPLTASASITGPTIVEVGKTYRFAARINDVLPTNTSRNYTVRGAWLMPDGSRIEADEADMTIQPGQTSVVFATWVDGRPGVERLNTFPLRPWTYVWPNWGLALQERSKQPPVLRYTLKPEGASLIDLRGEPIDVEWQLPENVSVTPEGQGLGGTIAFNAPGRYVLTARISDSRGNVTEVDTPAIEVLPPPQVTARMTVVSPYGEGKFYAPGKYTISHRIESVPAGDRFLKNEVYVNAEKVGEFFGSSAVVDITDPGEYTFRVRTLTQGGNYGDAERILNLAAAPAPTCTFARQESSVGVTIMPTCNVGAGYVSSYQWTYLLRGETLSMGSRSFYMRKADLPDISNIVLKVTASTGAQETYSVSKD